MVVTKWPKNRRLFLFLLNEKTSKIVICFFSLKKEPRGRRTLADRTERSTSGQRLECLDKSCCIENRVGTYKEAASLSIMYRVPA